MGKLECYLQGDFDTLLRVIEDGVLSGSLSASFEDGSRYERGELRCAVRVYERYSVFGGNRVSLNITLIGRGEEVFLSAITAGGSQAMFFKMNTLGEESFLNTLQDTVRPYMIT